MNKADILSEAVRFIKNTLEKEKNKVRDLGDEKKYQEQVNIDMEWKLKVFL